MFDTCPSEQVKSSVGMLKVFCQFLHGEGDFVRHLKKMGYVVTHVQSYIGERGERRFFFFKVSCVVDKFSPKHCVV